MWSSGQMPSMVIISEVLDLKLDGILVTTGAHKSDVVHIRRWGPHGMSLKNII